jgi:hypothetical protein
MIMKLKLNNLRKLISEVVNESSFSEEQAQLAAELEKQHERRQYNKHVAEYIFDQFENFIGVKAWERLLNHPDFNIVLNDYIKNVKNLDPGVPKAQQLIEDSIIDIHAKAFNGGMSLQSIKISPHGKYGLTAEFSKNAGWKIKI